jgi:hypothetical protein
MPLLAAKAIITVVGGIIPGTEMPEHSKRWSYTSRDYEEDRQVPQDQPTKFSKMLDEAHEYAKGLSNPAYMNWVRVDWFWV